MKEEEEEKISKLFSTLSSLSLSLSLLFFNSINSHFFISRVHRGEHVLLELAHHVPGLEVVAHVQVGAAVEPGAELGAAAEASGSLPQHLRGVARLFFF